MLITIDIGNTNITYGRFLPEDDKVLDYASFKTDKSMTTDDLALKYFNLLSLWKSRGSQSGAKNYKTHQKVIISSVVPGLDYQFKHMFEKYYDISPVFVKPADFPVEIDYDFPREIGADRIVNAYAGINLFPGSNLIIVDFGTATTFDVMTGDKVYKGGVIVPGIMSSLRSLSDNASKLPHIDLSVVSGVVGRNTVDGIRAGILHGNGGMLDELVKRIAEEMNWKQYMVISTGGLSDLIKFTAHSIDLIDRHLTLKGLYYYWKLTNE